MSFTVPPGGNHAAFPASFIRSSTSSSSSSTLFVPALQNTALTTLTHRGILPFDVYISGGAVNSYASF